MNLTLAKLVAIAAKFLAKTMPSADARKEARYLICDSLAISYQQFFVAPDRLLVVEEVRDIIRRVRRRAGGEPFAYITGRQEFYSLEFEVNSSVLIPRPETEELVDLVLQYYSSPPCRLIDIGTGSGCIATVLAVHWPNCQLTAVDVSKAALEVAGRNFVRHGVSDRIESVQSDLFGSVQDRFDVIVSNPPYVLRNEADFLSNEVRDFEPHTALFVEDAIGFYRRFFEQSYNHLIEDGWFYIESSPGLLHLQKELAESAGFNNVVIANDLSMRPRFLMGHRP